MSRFTIEVSAAELEVLSLAIGRMPNAKPVREAKPRTSVERPVFATGDAKIDEFMRRTWKPEHAVAAAKRRVAGIPAKAVVELKPRRWSFNETAFAAWRRLGHEVIIEGGIIRSDFGNVTVKPLTEAVA